jgi:hypothetical protein
MKGRLNAFSCAKCGNRGPVDVSLLHHDMEARYCVQYVTINDMKSPEFYQNLTKTGTVIVDPISSHVLNTSGGQYLEHPHHVFSMKEMRLYIAFRDLCATWGKDK